MNESILQYKLELAKGITQGETYRAKLVKSNDVMDTEATFEQIAKQTGYSALQLRTIFELVLRSLIQNTAADGRGRRIEGLLETRLDIKGSFDHLNDAFDSKKHSLGVNFVALKAARKIQRKVLPTNVLPPPHGRIQSVYSENGERGVIHYGRKIIIEGTNLRLSSVGEVQLRVDTPGLGEMYPHRCEVLENTPEKLVCAWPKSMEKYVPLKDFVAAEFGKVVRLGNDDEKPQRGRGNGTPIGCQVSVKLAK